MTQAKINPAILRWARKRLNLTEEEAARKIGLKEKPQRLQAWEQGEELPTFRQAQELARALQIPFGYLFLSHPPLTTLPIADFRTLPEAKRGKFGPELEDALNDAFRKRDWLRERRIQEGIPPFSFVGRFSLETPPQRIAKDIRSTLNLPYPTAKDVKSWDDHLRLLVQRAEQAGIVVLQSGYVLSNTHRTFSVQEFRGFALADPHAPLIFLNAKDSVNGRIFTLAHELAHVWTGTSGISNPDVTMLEKAAMPDVERLCNQAAAELLVPAQALTERWRSHRITEETAQDLAKEFRVSALVILIRAHEAGLLPRSDFQKAYAQTLQDIQEIAEETRTSGGGDFYRTLQTRNGRLLLGEIAQAVREGTLLYNDASWLLNIKPKTLEHAIHEF